MDVGRLVSTSVPLTRNIITTPVFFSGVVQEMGCPPEVTTDVVMVTRRLVLPCAKAAGAQLKIARAEKKPAILFIVNK